MSASSERVGIGGEGGTSPVALAAPALLLAAVLLSVAPWLGVVNSSDGSSTDPPVHSGWAAAVPLLVVVLLGLSRRAIGLAAIAGLGVFGLVRLIADLGVVIDPGETLRPELFGIQTLTAGPLQTNWAAWMLIEADLLMVAAAVIAGNVVADTLEPVARWEPERSGADQDGVAAGPESSRPRLIRSRPSTVVGMLAAAGYLAANLGEAYSDPLPVIRPGFTDIGLWGSITAAAAGLLLALAVLLSSALDATTARGLLVGLGLGAAGPPLVVVIGSIGNSTAIPSGLTWLALGSSALLLAAGLLRTEAAVADPAPESSPAVELEEQVDAGSVRRSNLLLGVTALISGALALGAFLLPQASFVFRSYLDEGSAAPEGVSDQDLTAGFEPAGSIFVLVTVVMLVAAVLTLAPRTQSWGRTVLTLTWAPAIAAFLFALQYVNQVRSPELVAGVVFQADTTYRAGLWLGLAATVLAIATGIAAPVVTGRANDLSAEDVPVVDIAERQPWAYGIAGGLSLLVLIGIGPQAWTSEMGSSAGLFAGADRTDFWAVWLTAIAVVVAFWVAVRHPRREIALSLFLASAAALLPRLVLTGDVRAQAGFEVELGFWLNIVLVVGVLIAGALVWTLIGAPTWHHEPVADQPAESRRAAAGSSAGSKSTVKSKGGKASAAAANPRSNSPRGKNAGR